MCRTRPVTAATRACRGCDPQTTLANGVDVLSGEIESRFLGGCWFTGGRLKIPSPIEIRETSLDDNQTANERAENNGVQNGSGRRVHNVTNEETSRHRVRE